eukprot:11209610-Lingulodinium_polyedra.AAC.1
MFSSEEASPALPGIEPSSASASSAQAGGAKEEVFAKQESVEGPSPMEVEAPADPAKAEIEALPEFE